MGVLSRAAEASRVLNGDAVPGASTVPATIAAHP